mmetsp:Transcript_15301/g.44432  ORF Transcript_15301/g.44432 Transcript_15301/m.44432 type:complete len:457 (-) Transcript_15301:234-1604(-)
MRATKISQRQHRRPSGPADRRWLLSLLLAAAAFPPESAEALQVTTFNVLAAVHRSMPQSSVAAFDAAVDTEAVPPRARESERREWWGPRAEGLARYVADELAASDVVLLQEWWFSPEFEELFDRHTAHIFDRAAERRPSREDGMAVLINKRGKLELLESSPVLTGPQRIAQIAQCQERGSGGRRRVTIANAHLSFPGGADPVANVRKQAMEVQLAARALDKVVATAAAADAAEEEGVVPIPDGLLEERRRRSGSGGGPDEQASSHLQIIGGDFNSNSLSLPALKLESPRWGYVNSATATAALTMASGSIGGRINLGVTHRTHRGEDVSVDHIFARTAGRDDIAGSGGEEPAAAGKGSAAALRGLGYLDGAGTRISFCRKRRLHLKGDGILSDHRPVTTVFEWPPLSLTSEGGDGVRRLEPWIMSSASNLDDAAEGGVAGGVELAALHPLQSPWDTP